MGKHLSIKALFLRFDKMKFQTKCVILNPMENSPSLLSETSSYPNVLKGKEPGYSVFIATWLELWPVLVCEFFLNYKV